MAAEFQAIAERRMVFRETNVHIGRNVSVTPANSTNRLLSYGRIILNDELKMVSFATGESETGLIILSGAARIDVDGHSFDLTQYDSVYIPRGCPVRVSTDSGVDIAEFAAPVTGTYPLQIIRHMDVSNDSSLKFTTGKPTQQRNLSILLGKNVNAGRLLAGFTVSDPGNWTSWPPHEHAALLEEMYVYFDMPEPALSETTAGSWWVPRPEKL